MVIDLKYGQIASWWFEQTKSINLKGNEREELLPLLNAVQIAVDILYENRLLDVEDISFEDWVKFEREKEEIIHVSEPSLEVQLDYQNLKGTLKDFMICNLDNLFQGRFFLYPLEIKITGSGIILGEKEESSIQKNVTWIHAVSFGVHVIDVCTQCDAWMEFDLFGNPQPGISKTNAPRLQKALTEIMRKFDSYSLIEENTDFAIVQGFRVCNKVDVDGEIIQIDFGVYEQE
jgi:hypothetical protein